MRNMNGKLGTGVLMLACAACVLPGASVAQEGAVVATPARETASATDQAAYGPDYFERFSPNVAEDILRVIPGVPAILDAATDQQARGFGGGGARILLNGRRFPGKANEISANLRRIPASVVVRVELISGSAEGVSVQSDGILVNIVTQEGRSIAGTGSWEANLRFNDAGRAEPDGLLSYNGAVGPLGYSLGVERNVWSPYSLGSARYSDRFRDEIYYYPNGQVQETRPQDWTRDHDKWVYTAGAVYDFRRGDRLQLNGFFQTLDIKEVDATDFTRFSPAGAVALQASEEHVRTTGQRQTLELGGEYEGVWAGGTLNALGIVRRDTSPVRDARNQQVGARLIELSQSQSKVETGEDIIRVSYAHPLWARQTLEVGGEAARNTLDQTLRVFFDRNGDDRVEEVVIPTGSAEVEEIRGEVFATHRWSITDALSSETRLTYERSSITNNYPFSPERTLGFLKPRLDVRYRPSSSTRFRLLVDRTVSQLDFNLFVPKFDFVDNEIDAGNPGIEPEKTWLYEVGVERRLSKDGGLLEGRVFYKDIADAIDKIPLIDSVGRTYSADGNLPKAKVYGAEVKASLRLTPIGLKDGLLSVRHTWQMSETKDPFTGESRRLKSDFGNNYEIGYRQDVTAMGASFGFNYQKVGQAIITSDLFVREYFRVGPTLTAFIEKQFGAGYALRFEAQNLTGSHEDKSRLLYAVNARDGALRRYEHWDEERDMRFALRLRGAF